eukprot:12901182-Prorocentrum_lima.AAC.1
MGLMYRAWCASIVQAHVVERHTHQRSHTKAGPAQLPSASPQANPQSKPALKKSSCLRHPQTPVIPTPGQ